MSSERTIRRRVSELKQLFNEEITKCLNKLKNTSESNSIDISKSIETSKPPDVNPALNAMCLMNTLEIKKRTSLDQLIANQFERPKVEAVENQVQIQNETIDKNFVKNEEVEFNNMLQRTIRRRVSELKQLFNEEITRCLNKLKNTSESISIDISKSIETSKPSDGIIPQIKKPTSLDQLIANQFKRPKDEAVENQVQIQNETIDKNLVKNEEVEFNDMLRSDERKKNSEYRFNLNDYLQNVSNEESGDESEGDLEEDFLAVEDDKKINFVNEIRELCLKYIHIITHEYVEELISKLRKETGAPFPKTARTFFKTPRKIETRKMGSGDYCYYGLESAIT
ncbi:hypothetical protein TSAR_016175 [Trichomalopsis sarcophagae]|uniref:Uncharacterized protein n=1 Tax=Trichomalopsis sarcophagae TaxID=543379 RepID=A0A232EE35_9HYME|nr:hypothetical protein TSAR_016175 [Trichomalopsis sarcophagae]